MNIIKRSWLYITRKKSKTFIMFLILFGIATATISGLSIRKATQVERKQIDEAIKSGFTVTHNIEKSLGLGDRGIGAVPAEVVNEIKEIEGVDSYKTRMISEADLINEKKVEREDNPIQMIEDLEKYKKVIDLEGTTDSSLDEKFVSGVLKLTEGRHIQADDKHQVIVHEEFAKQNNLKLNDSFTVERSEYASVPTDKPMEEDPLSLEIVGLFTGENSERATSDFDLVENVFISDLHTPITLRGEELDSAIFGDAHFYTKDDEALEKVIKELGKLSFDPSDYTFRKLTNEFPSLTGSFDQMEQLIHQLLIGIVVVSVIILSLILAFWINGRIHETGVLLSLGISKINIIGQYIVELMMIAVLAFGLSYFSGQKVAQTIGDSMVEQATEKSSSSFNQSLGGMQFGGDPSSNTITKTIDEIDVSVSLKEVVAVWLVGSLIILISVGASSIFVIHLKPKEILSKMS